MISELMWCNHNNEALTSGESLTVRREGTAIEQQDQPWLPSFKSAVTKVSAARGTAGKYVLYAPSSAGRSETRNAP